jgi:hypothetical protein
MSAEPTAAEALRCIGAFIDDAEHFELVDDSVVDIGPVVEALTVLTETAAERDRLRAEKLAAEDRLLQQLRLIDRLTDETGALRAEKAELVVAVLEAILLADDDMRDIIVRAAHAKITATEGDPDAGLPTADDVRGILTATEGGE